MLDHIIKLILIFLLIFTPLAFGSMDIWAFSVMELGILLIIILAAIQYLFLPPSATGNPQSHLPIVLLSLFLALILLQVIPVPAGVLQVLSPKTYELRGQLIFPGGPMPNNLWPISFFPFATLVEFFKWLALAGLFVFLLRWRHFSAGQPATKSLLVVIMLVGIAESFYGIFEFFSGHRHILYLDGKNLMSSVTGTFINRNYFAGYLLMVIPLSLGFLFSRQAGQTASFKGWRHRLSSLDGKTLLAGFGLVLMILGLLFSASRMGIVSLLLSFTMISFFFRRASRERMFSRTTGFIFGLALLWAAWIGMDAVISRFFTTTEDFKMRWLFWSDTFQILKDFPLFGTGLGTFAQVFPVYRSFHIQGIVTHAENDFLQLASEVGLIGLSLLAALFIFLLHKASSKIRSLSASDPSRYIAIGGLVGILALMLHSLVERNIQVPANAFLYTFLWALILKVPKPPPAR